VLDLVVIFLEDYQKNIENLEKMRANWSDQAVKLHDEQAIAKLQKLEQRLDKIIADREQFTTGSKWSGQRQIEDGALHMNLAVTNRTGTSFVGELKQSAGGPGTVMKVEGKLDRNKMAFQTTQMLRGANRRLSFNGYLLSDRIITSVNGITFRGKPATGWVTLWRDGLAAGQESQRGRTRR
jgi:hypothetical protein